MKAKRFRVVARVQVPAAALPHQLEVEVERELETARNVRSSVTLKRLEDGVQLEFMTAINPDHPIPRQALSDDIRAALARVERGANLATTGITFQAERLS